MYLQTCAPSEDFIGRFSLAIFSTILSCGQKKIISDCTDTHAELRFRWAHMSEGAFSQVVGPLYNNGKKTGEARYYLVSDVQKY